jgi:acyl-CoA thioester hydrolase
MVTYFEHHHRVSQGEIDDLGHAGNYHYVRWMQHAATAHSTANGWSPERYSELGAGWVVRSHQITYLKPAFRGDELVIRTWVANMKPATSLRRYEICLGSGIVLARAETDWAFINYAKQRAVRIPLDVAESFTVVEGPDLSLSGHA